MSEGPGGIKLSIYGRSKTGKTRLACSFPKPLLLIGTEDGTKSVANRKVVHPTAHAIHQLFIGNRETGIHYRRIETSSQIEECADLLRTGNYKSLVLDTAGGLQDLIVKEVLGLDDIPIQRDWGMAQQRDWGVIGSQTKERLRTLLDLAGNLTNLNVVIVAHERSFNEEGNSSLILPTVGSALTPSAAGWLNGACDYICQCFVREEVKRTDTEVNGKIIEMEVRTGKMEYCLRTGAHSVYMTGFRVLPGVTLPDEIVDPSYEKILKLIEGE